MSSISSDRSEPVVVAGCEPASPAARLKAVRHLIPITIAALVGLVLAIAAWSMVSRWEDRTARHEFAAIDENKFLAHQHGLDEYLNKLNALRALLESDESVTRREFETFTGRLLETLAPVQNFSWVPRVTRAARAAHERAAVADGLVEYSIKAVDASDRISTSEDRDEYLPIRYYGANATGSGTHLRGTQSAG